jgi:hypothetical protein
MGMGHPKAKAAGEGKEKGKRADGNGRDEGKGGW